MIAALEERVVSLERDRRIVEAAATCFVEYGFKRTSIEQVAQQAGVGKGTVYLACENKEDLFYKAVHKDLVDWTAHILQFVDPRRPVAEILHALAKNGVTYLGDHPLVRGLFAGVHERLLPDWAERFADLRTSGRATLAEVFRQGVRKGELRADLDVELAAAIVQDLQHSCYIVYGEAWLRDVPAAETRLHAQVELILHGLRP